MSPDLLRADTVDTLRTAAVLLRSVYAARMGSAELLSVALSETGARATVRGECFAALRSLVCGTTGTADLSSRLEKLHAPDLAHLCERDSCSSLGSEGVKPLGFSETRANRPKAGGNKP